MNNLHRELAPITEGAWSQIEDEARRTFKRSIAGRRVVDVVGPGGPTLSAVGTGHLRPLDPPMDGVLVRQRQVQPIIELRVPFSVTRAAVDDVERGAADSDWQPVKDAATRIALAEDRMIFHGWAATGITGIAPSSSQPGPAPAGRRRRPSRQRRARPEHAATRRGRRSVQPAAVARTCTPRSPRPPSTVIPSAITSTGCCARVKPSGRRPWRARSWCPPGAATTRCTWVRTCRSATCRTTPTTSSSTCRNR